MSNEGQRPPSLNDLLANHSFWQLHNGTSEIRGSLDRLPRGTVPVLKRLGSSPFTKTRFPVVGFLETVYDHIAEHARGRLPEEK